MNHSDVESLLGAYAVDAVDPDEAAIVDQHIATCPRCRAEVTSHREVAALLGSGHSTEVPPELWNRVAAAIAPEAGPRAGQPGAPAPVEPLAAVVPISSRLRRRWQSYATGLGAAAASAAVVLLSFQVSHLDGEIHSVAAENGLSGAVAAALVAPHQQVTLTGNLTADDARIVISPDSDAYWVSSDLPVLPQSETYQVWSGAGSKVVSIEVLGPDPTKFAAFRVTSSVQRIMVTVEPAGGSAVPTMPILVQAPFSSD